MKLVKDMCFVCGCNAGNVDIGDTKKELLRVVTTHIPRGNDGCELCSQIKNKKATIVYETSVSEENLYRENPMPESKVTGDFIILDANVAKDLFESEEIRQIVYLHTIDFKKVKVELRKLSDAVVSDVRN